MRFAFVICVLAVAGVAHAGEVGIASQYCEMQQTASGAHPSCNDFVAAHKTLPFGKRVKVTNLATGKSGTVTIVDRGPFVKGRVIDLSTAAANTIGLAGLTRVEITLE